VHRLAANLMSRALPAAMEFRYLRPCAYALLGADAYLDTPEPLDIAPDLHRRLAERLYEVWRLHQEDVWPWWEDNLTWGNAKLPHAMLVAGRRLESEEMTEAALKALRWLLEVQTGEEGQLSIIGNQGWYYRGGKPAKFDQQPIEAKALVQACLAAADFTGEADWAEEACRCFEWFTGRNDLKVTLYNAETGGGQDGLEPGGVNLNQGAESTLAYLMSVLELHHYDVLTTEAAADRG
jgi:hypothetical protein